MSSVQIYEEKTFLPLLTLGWGAAPTPTLL